MKNFKLPTIVYVPIILSCVALCFLLAVAINSSGNSELKKDWYLTGHVNPENNKEFIVNDSLVIKSGDFVTLMTVFCHGKKTKSEMFQHQMEDDASLIRHLQWQYEEFHKDEKIYKPAVVGGFK